MSKGMQLQILTICSDLYLTAGEDAYIELPGSPHTLIRQKEGVGYALNCGGPAYQAISDITYTSEHKQFASFDGSDGKGWFGKYICMKKNLYRIVYLAN